MKATIQSPESPKPLKHISFPRSAILCVCTASSLFVFCIYFWAAFLFALDCTIKVFKKGLTLFHFAVSLVLLVVDAILDLHLPFVVAAWLLCGFWRHENPLFGMQQFWEAKRRIRNIFGGYGFTLLNQFKWLRKGEKIRSWNYFKVKLGVFFNQKYF